jgi:hypothetical protein
LSDSDFVFGRDNVNHLLSDFGLDDCDVAVLSAFDFDDVRGLGGSSEIKSAGGGDGILLLLLERCCLWISKWR